MSKVICTKVMKDGIDIKSILSLLPGNIPLYIYSNSNGAWIQSDAVTDGIYNICNKLLGEWAYIPTKLSSYGTTISSCGLNIRSENNETCNIIGVLDFGQRFKILEETKDWYHISHPLDGYIYKLYTQVSQTPSTVSENLIKFTASWEGFSATPYQDAGGNWTVGFGECTYNKKPEPVTYQQALEMLTTTLNSLAQQISNSLGQYNLTQYQLDALVDFSYNLGFNALMESDLVANLETCDNNSIIKGDFTAWSYCDGEELYGLLRRRKAEYQMFLFAEYNNN